MKKLLTGFAVLVLSLSVALPAAAQANPQRAAEIRNEARENADARKQKREDKVAEIKSEVEARRAMLTQEKCEARKARLETRIPKLSKSAVTVKGVIDRMYEKVQGFYEDGQLAVSNYEELVAAIELAKSESETSLEALESYEFEVDCESETIAAQIDSYRTAVKEAREDLKSYRGALVGLISSLRAETAEQEGADTEEPGTGTEDSNTDTPADTSGTEVEND